MKKTTIDVNLLPNIWLKWTTTKAVFYMNCSDGVKQTNQPDVDFGYEAGFKRLLINSGSKPRFAYVKYHEDIEMLELAEVTIDTTRKEEIKQWRYSGDKYFLRKDKVVLDESGNVKNNGFIMSQYHTSRDFKGFLGMLYRISCYSNVDEFKKFLGSDTYTVGSGRVVNVTCCWQIQEWYKTKQKVRGPGKQQKLTDKLVAMPISDASDLIAKYPVKVASDGFYRYSTEGFIYFERLTDGWSVLRFFNKSYNSDNCTEKERMYLHDGGANRIVAPSKDCWVPAKQNNGWTFYRFVNKDEAMEKCARLKYILPLIASESNTKLKGSLMTILRFPEVEQMIRLGYTKAAEYVYHSCTPKAELNNIFGDYYNEKETTILRKSGLTKHQLDKHMARYATESYRCDKALREMRKYFGADLIHLDNTSFDKYYDAFMEICSMYYRGEAYSQLNYMNIDRKKFIKNLIRIGEKNNNVYRVANDTLSRYNSLNTGTQPEINWYFNSYSDVVRAHDAIDELKRAQDAERRAMWNMAEAERRKKEEEKRIKIDKERKQYEYEDDTYIIRLPNDSGEIVREGNIQRICIGGYTTNHALGHTNLFFLRKKSEPNVPFYAIEMSNHKTIVQIHGFSNSWLGNNPEAIPTVVRWMRKNGIKCDEKILTCKARGYHAINEYVKMPVVD